MFWWKQACKSKKIAMNTTNKGAKVLTPGRKYLHAGWLHNFIKMSVKP